MPAYSASAGSRVLRMFSSMRGTSFESSTRKGFTSYLLPLFEDLRAATARLKAEVATKKNLIVGGFSFQQCDGVGGQGEGTALWFKGKPFRVCVSMQGRDENGS